MNKKEIATSFLHLASSGDVRNAYDNYVHNRFIHHNAFFKGDRESFLSAMENNAHEFPNKTYETVRVIEEGNFVVVHGKVVLSPDSQWSVIHIFRFEENKIVESWEASQEILKDSPNENGLF